MSKQDAFTTISVELTEAQAEGLAEFFKRVGFSEYRAQASSEAEAYAMRDGAERVRTALAEAGFSPR